MSANLLLSATAIDLSNVEVLFANVSTPAAPADGVPFSAAAWKLTPDPASDLPAYTPALVVSAVATTGNLGVVITSDQELTPGVVYTATLTGASGIATDGIHNVVAFTSFPITSAPPTRDFELIDFIPPINIREDDSGELADFIACLQEPLDLLWNDVDRWIEILDCDLAPENFVDIILTDLGNPFVFGDPLSLNDKRKLCHILVEIYKLKGTCPGIQAAVLFFLGLHCEIVGFSSTGDKLAKHGITTGFGRLSKSGTHASQTFTLGGGGPWEGIMKLGTVLDPSIGGSTSGSNATELQLDRALKILQVMKPCYLTLHNNTIRSGAEPTARAAIKDNGSGSVDLIMAPIANSAAYVFIEGGAAGITQFNSTASHAATGSPPTVSALTPGSTKFWNGIGNNTTTGNLGLLFNEVTNAMTKPVLTVTPGVRKLVLTWPAVTGATSYRIYKSAATFTSPCVADNAGTPIEVSGDILSYTDKEQSGTARFYRITPVKCANAVGDFPNASDSEGFFSDIATGTAT